MCGFALQMCGFSLADVRFFPCKCCSHSGTFKAAIE
jgi:hypothetical protein